MVTTDGRTRTRVTDDLVVAWFWSPDGRQLAFVTLERERADVRLEGGGRQRHQRPPAEQLHADARRDPDHGVLRPVRHLARAVGAGQQRAGVRRRVAGRATGARLSGPGVIQSVPTDGKSQPKTVIGGNFVAMPGPGAVESRCRSSEPPPASRASRDLREGSVALHYPDGNQ